MSDVLTEDTPTTSIPEIPVTPLPPEKPGDVLEIKKKRKSPGRVPRALKPLIRRVKLTMRDALLEAEGELSLHMQQLMLNIISDRRSIKYKAREQIAALELMARILGRLAPTENVIMPIPQDQLKKRLEDIYVKIRGVQKGGPDSLLLGEPVKEEPPTLADVSTDQAFEEEVPVDEAEYDNGGGNYN